MRESLRCLGIAVCVVAILFVACALVFVRTNAPTAGAPATGSGAEAAADGGVSAETREDGQGDADEERTLAVVMYHNILKSSKGTYTVSPAQLASDLAAYEAAGYETVFPSEIVAFVCGEGDLPEKPLLLTFDDGRYNNMYYGLPLLKKYGAKAAFYPVATTPTPTTLTSPGRRWGSSPRAGTSNSAVTPTTCTATSPASACGG